MSRRVLVTRTGREARPVAERLAEMGFSPVILPLTEVRRLPAIPLPDPGSFGAVAITSPNAIRLAPPELLGLLAGTPCHAVGERTAETARDHGLTVAGVGSGGGAALGRAIAAADPRPAALLFLCGKTRSGELERALGDAGIPVHALEIYDSRAVEHTFDHIGAATQWMPIRYAMVHSRQAADELRKLVQARPFSFLFENTCYVCISQRVAGAFDRLPGATVKVAGQPTGDAMLALLAEQA